MPTYQYECDHCGHHFDILQGITEAKIKICPKCHQESLYRLIGSGGGLIFKGNGFYSTDYKKKACSDTSCPAKDSCQTGPSKGCGCGDHCSH